MDTSARRWLLSVSLIAILAACSADDGAPGSGKTTPEPAVMGPSGGSAGQTAPPPTTPGPNPVTSNPVMNPVAAPGAAGSAAPPPTTPPAAGGSSAPPMNTAGSGPMAGTPPTPAGPEDGDPAMPAIAIPDVPCGGPAGGRGRANFMMDGRDMIVTYPCDKHGGAPATFILNLHGTTPLEQHFYQHGYFAAHTFAASHNLIIVTPSSVVQQWGNGDEGKDEPHLMKIIEWVYANLGGAGKFDIRGMWVGGHSWGGGYTARFGCKAELADKVKGLILMSGGGVTGFSAAACASKVSVIITTAEGDNRMPGDQAMVATGHGCAAVKTEMILQNVHTFWPDCKPGFVHANFYMLGKMHATYMDRDVVEKIVNWIKLGRQ